MTTRYTVADARAAATVFLYCARVWNLEVWKIKRADKLHDNPHQVDDVLRSQTRHYSCTLEDLFIASK